MKILFIAAEVAPFVSVGGLSQVMYFLPKALARLGHDVRIFTAKYGTMDDTAPKNGWDLHTELSQLSVPTGTENESLICNVKLYNDRPNKLKTYFLENREYYELRANVFGYRDDHVRFGLLSKGALEWLMKQKQTNGWFPDVIHAHDWHTAYVPDLARRDQRYQSTFAQTPFVLTVHNFAFQGNYDFRYCAKEEYDDGTAPLAPLLTKKFQTQNALKRGILYSDAVNTVSQTHAVEVLTPEYAEGLENVLQSSREKLTGILNGLDVQKFNPATDTRIKRNYSSRSFQKAREENKKELQKIFGLSLDPTRPLLAFCGRLTKQKGLDLILDVLPPLLSERPDVQVILVGSGDERYRMELTVLQKNFKKQIGLYLRPDFRLPRKIYAGADMMLLPSIFEPGGIVCLEALRYGAVPIVRRTGGLNDIITDFNPMTKKGNGLSFRHKDHWSLYGAIVEALTWYQYPKLWKVLVKNALVSDFSWDHAAQSYDVWYKRVVAQK
jgi:starch synthase